MSNADPCKDAQLADLKGCIEFEAEMNDTISDKPEVSTVQAVLGLLALGGFYLWYMILVPFLALAYIVDYLKELRE